MREPGREPLDGGDPEHVRQLGLLPPDLLLRPLALGDVADRADEPATGAVVELADVEVHGKIVPSLRRPRTSRVLPMVYRSPVFEVVRQVAVVARRGGAASSIPTFCPITSPPV